MRETHCWTGNVEYAEETYGLGSKEWIEAMENPSTCMLLNKHEGPHEFTFDGDISLSFAPKDGK